MLCANFIVEISETIVEINDLRKAIENFQELEHNGDRPP